MRVTSTSDEPLRLRFTIEIEVVGATSGRPTAQLADVAEVAQDGADTARHLRVPSHVEVIPEKVAFTVPETAVWLGFMQSGESTASSVYRAACQRVRRLVQRGELRQRALGGKSYLIPGDAIREYLAACDEPITAPAGM